MYVYSRVSFIWKKINWKIVDFIQIGSGRYWIHLYIYLSGVISSIVDAISKEAKVKSYSLLLSICTTASPFTNSFPVDWRSTLLKKDAQVKNQKHISQAFRHPETEFKLSEIESLYNIFGLYLILSEIGLLAR